MIAVHRFRGRVVQSDHAARISDGLREMLLCDAVFESAQKGEWTQVED